MTPEDQERFFTGGVRHGTLARCFWEVATDLEAQQGNHEEYVKAAFVRAIAAAVAEEREACAHRLEETAVALRRDFERGCAAVLDSEAVFIRERQP